MNSGSQIDKPASALTRKGTQVCHADFDELRICYRAAQNKGYVFFYMCWDACLGVEITPAR